MSHFLEKKYFIGYYTAVPLKNVREIWLIEQITIDKSIIPTFGIYVHTIANEPKVGIKPLLKKLAISCQNLLCLLVPGFYSLFAYFLLLYSEPYSPLDFQIF